jgi:hypothetical protein
MINLKLSAITLLTFCIVGCYADAKNFNDSKGGNQIPINVICEPQRDVGFYVAAHLNLPDVAICVYNKKFIDTIEQIKKEMSINDDRLTKEAPELSKELNKYWKVHRLVRVPVLFNSFKDTETAYALLLGTVKRNSTNEKIYNKLKTDLLSLYPFLDKLSPKEKLIAKKLISLIEYEYYHFYKKYGELHKEQWKIESISFKNAWFKEYGPAISVLNSKNHSIKEIEIILSPALQRHGKSFRVINGIGRVATLLPSNNEEMQRGLQNAYHEMCHGISDKIVYKEMKLKKSDMSFKADEAGSEIHSIIENAADQAMYLGLQAGNPEMLEYFFNNGMYGNLSWIVRKDTFTHILKLIGRNISKKEISKLLAEMITEPVKTSKYIYAKGLLVNKKVLEQLVQIV